MIHRRPTSTETADRKIAVVGIGGVFPGSSDLEQFWTMILEGRTASRPVPAGRWVIPPTQAFDPTPGAVDRVYSTRACLADNFHLDFADLNIDSALAARLDPAFSFALAAGKQAWFDCRNRNVEPDRVGVILGNIVLPTEATNALTEEFLAERFAGALGVSAPRPFRDRFDPYSLNAAHLPAAILARALGISGRTLCLDAACASSLYAFKLATDELLAGRADIVLAGGVSRPDCLYTQMGFGQLRALSPSGICAPFDAKADGLVVGEGAGIFALKRLADAVAADDRIYGVLCGFGLSNDIGGRLLAPSSEGQLRALHLAYQQAGWRPEEVDLIECHATGTQVGDAVEFESLAGLHLQSERRGRRIILGSVKSNVGHLLTGAGAAGLMKALFAFRDRLLPPTAHFETPNAKLGIAHSPFEVLARPREWHPHGGQPLRAAINGFGFGGINAHALIEEFREPVSATRVSTTGFTPQWIGDVPIAVVAADVIVGQAVGLEAVYRSLFGFNEANAADDSPARRLDAIRVAVDRFRIPPRELEDILPQQLLMLLAADNATKFAGWQPGTKSRTGAFIGLELDLDATNFHFRWSLATHGREWAAELGSDCNDAELADWVEQLRTAAGPPLTANRVMGALGGIVASRVAREFEIGGPCHTVSCEAASGLAGIALAVDALAMNELDEVLVGAVDLAADPRWLATRPPATNGRFADGAAAVVLKRLDDAQAAGNCILCVIDESASTNIMQFESACSCGAATGLVDFVVACLALNRKELPLRSKPWPWLVDRSAGPRAVVVSACDGLDKKWQRTLREHEADIAAKVSPTEFAAPLNDRKSNEKIAFVFSGSGNQYPGMGRELAAFWPELVAEQEETTQHLRSQLQPERFWYDPPIAGWDDNVARLIVGQVAWSILACAAVRSLGIEPEAAIGYSLGESSALFALGVWTARDEMFGRLESSPLFTTDLCGPCNAARKAWSMPAFEKVDWTAGVVNASAVAVVSALPDFERAYLLIVNAPDECVIGGDMRAVQAMAKKLAASFVPLRGVGTVHCLIAKSVAEAYRRLHLLPTTPTDVRFYSSAWGKAYELTGDSAADAILAQALDTVDFARTIEAAYADGIRVFVEIGPGNSCGRAIGKTLFGRPHRVYSPFVAGQSEAAGLLDMAERLVGDTPALQAKRQETASRLMPVKVAAGASAKTIAVRVGLPDRRPPGPPMPRQPKFPTTHQPVQHPNALQTETVLSQTNSNLASTDAVEWRQAHSTHNPSADLSFVSSDIGLDAHSAAHEAFLRFSQQTVALFAQQALLQAELLAGSTMAIGARFTESTENLNREVTRPIPETTPTSFDRSACLEYGVGRIVNVLGWQFAEVDEFPTRVRLPDVPLNFVDRIVAVDAVPKSMSHGNVVTEHDVPKDAWYLDNGVMPTCFTVEAGQADLFLSGYLGIDFVTRGLAVYRLLDAKVTFHRGLPRPGETIQYDIWIDGFFRQGETHLFRFRFEGTVDGQPLLSMREGCAGFFTAEELASGKGIVHTELDRRKIPGKTTADWRPFAPLTKETFTAQQLDALRAGDLAGCFGAAFEGLPLANPLTLPGGSMKLIDRVVELEPTGGRYGLGRIRAEADIHPDDWFIVCHFVDDPVMPGTLMYECCLHTLRVFLLRMGWVAESTEAVCEPLPGVVGSLKCRGQVLGSTKVAAYEVSIREIGYRPEPYAVVDALMFADGKPIVEITGMSLKMTGVNRERFEAIWANRGALESPSVLLPDSDRRAPIFDFDSIHAFAVGKPSDAFGDRYRIFDSGRVIARLPGPPYQFLDRIVEIEAEAWKMTAGGRCVAQYDVPPDAWYFEAERQPLMPFAVLLEVALQPCGWLAAYVGSALTSDSDLSFRNLGGTARLLEQVRPGAGTLTTEVKLTRCSASGGMIIQNYDMVVRNRGRVVYQGDTYFGFFSKQALANQVGIRDANLYRPDAGDLYRSMQADFPSDPPYPSAQLRMIDQIETFAPDGGPAGLGFIRGIKKVDPTEWFFKAHFYQDPVCPGSLGLESFLQLLKVVADWRWGPVEWVNQVWGGEGRIQQNGRKPQNRWLERALAPTTHSWVYRGQVIPADNLVTVEAVVKSVDDSARTLTADGYLSVDGRIIYQMKDFSLASKEANL